MDLTRHNTTTGPRWAADGNFLPAGVTLSGLLALPAAGLGALIGQLKTDEAAVGELLAPIDAAQEVWGSGVTYLRSRDARKAESKTSADVYQLVYDAERPEIFFKQVGWRTVGHGQNVRIRADTTWNVPEPELVLVINAGGEIVGYTVGNDMSSRDIEGENPLYLPQAKTYNGSCAVGPGIRLLSAPELADLPIQLEISRGGGVVFAGETATSRMKRTFPDLAAWLYRELAFPHGSLLMTGTGVVPPDDFTLRSGDLIRVTIGGMKLENAVG
ncbi:MAG: fumarylacetoacetate hydrolase [Chloroflexi bacterium]|nr:MAG: fumarylacetoacetate hydrolase [Chloroflexota bacterium]